MARGAKLEKRKKGAVLGDRDGCGKGWMWRRKHLVVKSDMDGWMDGWREAFRYSSWDWERDFVHPKYYMARGFIITITVQVPVPPYSNSGIWY